MNFIKFLTLLLMGAFVHVLNAQECNQEKILIIGAYETPLSFLNYAKEEVDSIAMIASSQKVMLLEGEDATLEKIDKVKSFAPSIVHISSNGFLLPNNKDYIIPLYGKEKLELTEDKSDIKSGSYFKISEFNQIFPNGINMVVISSSESNNPVVIEVLKNAGVKSAILSTHTLDDEIAFIFMTNFYKNYLNGMTKQEALQQAQKSVRETPGFEDPEYWAAFILLDALN